MNLYLWLVYIKGRVKAIELYEEANLGTQILSNIRRAHFEEPTPIQRYALPCIRQREDLMACAQTGSGKTVRIYLKKRSFIITNLLILTGCFSFTNYFQFIIISC